MHILSGGALFVGLLILFSTTIEAAPQKDLSAPFSVHSALDFPAPSSIFTNGREIRGVLSGPINTEEADRDFFTRPEFDTGGNSGRLFYQRFTLANRHDPFIGEESVWFVCWQPLRSAKSAGALAQRLFARSGYEIMEIETDGKRLLARLTPVYGSKKKDTPTDRYLWKGDAFGHGQFVPEGTPLRHVFLTAPNAFQTHRDQGYAALSHGNGKQAVTEFIAALALRPADAACWYALGAAYEGKEIVPGSAALHHAIDAYGKAIAHDPARIPAYQSRAQLYRIEKQYDKAIADLSHVLQREPKDFANYTLRAQLYAEKGDYAKAAADARKAIHREPTESEPHRLLATYLYRSGNLAGAITSAHEALKQDDANNAARLILAYVYARQNQAEKAKQQIRDARNNGITYDERHEGMDELRRVYKAHPDSGALKAVYSVLRDPEEPSL